MENKRKYDKRYCIAFGCLNSNKKKPDLSLFSLPKDAERRREWLILVGREDLLSKEDLKYKGYEVCSAHFDESSFKLIKQLKPNAVPTKFLRNPAQDTLSSTDSEESTDVSSITKPKASNIRTKKHRTVSAGVQTDISILAD